MSDTLLLIEDEVNLARELQCHLQDRGWTVAVADTLSAARRLLVEQALEPLVVLSDMSLSDGNALDLLESIRGEGLSGEWIFLTGYGSIPESVRALRLGAYDFLEKPCEPERLDLVIAGAARSARAQRRLSDQAHSQMQKFTPASFIGSSQASEEVRTLLTKVSRVPFSALTLYGETGTGKGLAARILHHAGLRSEGLLVELNCAALPKELMESELFGYEAGAFTGAGKRRRGLFEQADGGTLFLDEVGEMTPELQSKLLKAIEDKAFRRLGGEREVGVDVQIIAATHRDLDALVKEGAFRSDLYHRLNVFRIDLPPLRERKADLADLLPQFIAEYNAKAKKQVQVVPGAIWERLRNYDWPGNVRELRNVIERCVLLAEGSVFPDEWLQLDTGAAKSPADDLRLRLDGTMSLEDIERTVVQTALAKHQGNITATARSLSTTRDTLRYRIEKYGLENH